MLNLQPLLQVEHFDCRDTCTMLIIPSSLLMKWCLQEMLMHLVLKKNKWTFNSLTNKIHFMLLICCYLFLFRTKCINTPCKCHFINKMEGFINIIHISLQSKCSTCSRSCKNDQTCNNAYRKWRGSHNPRFTRYPTLKITIKIIMLEPMKGLDTVGQCNFRPWILVIRNSKQMIIK